MATAPDPYVNTQPGDLITAQLFNGLQSTIRQDIAGQIKKAIEELKTVDNAGDSAKLGGKTAKELEEEIIKRALSELPKRTGYKMYFRRLRKERDAIIKHDLYACPLVDVYQLDYFPVICATGDSKDDRKDQYVNFYLYHSSENKFTSVNTPSGTKPPTFEIEPTDPLRRPFRLSFEKLLDLYGVEYEDSWTLENLETEFWKKFWDDPDEEFEQDQYCHSPWFEKCCGEQRTVGGLKTRGNWDDILFQMRPRKMVRFPQTRVADALQTLTATPSAQADVQVLHFDFERIGVRLLADPIYPVAPPPTPSTAAKDASLDVGNNITDAAKKELKVMILLKV